MQMTVGKKIILGFGSLIVLLAIIGITTNIMVRKTKDITERTINVRYPTVYTSNNALKHLEASLARVRSYMLTGESKYKEQRAESIKEMGEQLKELEKISVSWTDQTNKDNLKKIINTYDDFSKSQKKAEDLSFTESGDKMIVHEGKKMKYNTYVLFYETVPLSGSIRGMLDEMIDNQLSLVNKDKADAISMQNRTTLFSLALALIGIIVGAVIATFLYRNIRFLLSTTVTDLTDTANQMSSASSQVSSSSQSVAQGATEQASSLQETSATLEELASMSRQNADNAKQANQIAQETRNSANDGAKSMTELEGAMSAINNSSDKISKIIKVIEEIAFQTNLLALNAAVEAARAGEHGKGFAVVAEEVRNLAQRSASAAKDTAVLIEESVDKIQNGTEITKKVSDSLNNIVTNVKRVTDLVAEIAAASQEQAEGVTQMNSAVTQMDSVTQQNASSAEESAAASEELSAQAESLTKIVDDLSQIVGVADEGAARKSSANKLTHKFTHKLNGLTQTFTKKNQNEKHALAGISSRSEHSQHNPARKSLHDNTQSNTIPMDDESFKGF